MKPGPMPMKSETDQPVQIILLSEDESQVAPLGAHLAGAGFQPEVITFYELQERNRVSKIPALLVLNFQQGVAGDNDWEILILLLSRAHNLFPQNYTMLLLSQAAPRYLARIGLTGTHECHLSDAGDPAVAQAALAAIESGALPAVEPILPVPERMLEVCEQIGSYQQTEALARMIVNQMTGLMDAERSSVWIRDKSIGQLRLTASHGLPDEVVRQAGPPPEGSIISWVMKNNQPLVLHESIKDTRFQSVSASASMKSSLCLPMSINNEVLGVFTLGRTRSNAPYFSHADLQACAVVASSAAVSLKNAILVEELIQRERLATVGQTIAGVAHCMKNIFTALNGGLYLLEHGITKNDFIECQKSLDILQRSSSRLNMLVMNMLDYSKSRKAVREEIRLRELFDEIVHLIVPSARQKNVDIQTSVDKHAELVYLDQSRLYRALVNLAANAIDAMGDGGVLTMRAISGGDPIATESVEASSGDDEGGVMLKRRPIIIEVKDTGMGIPPDVQSKLFEPFFSTKGSKGTGLGLASVKQFVDEQGGQVEIESYPGVGTTFRLLF